MIAHLRAARPGLRVVATGDSTPEDLRESPGPGSNRLSHKAFLDRHHPGAALLTGTLDLPLALHLDRYRVRMIWADAVAGPPRRWSLLNRAGTETPRGIRAILPASEAEAARLTRERDTGARVEFPGPLQPVPLPLPYSTAERDELARHLSGRPVWLCVNPAPSEYPAILAAHRIASLLSHRLLLIVAVPPEAGASLAETASRDDWHVALRSHGDEPVADVQVYIGDDLDELGLWYRLAAVTFLGGTLSGARPPRAPFEPATLGSAVLHGPQVGPHAAEILRLARAGAARRVDTGEALGQAVTRLLSPDAAAEMAAAGWDVTTAGAPAINRIVDLVEEMLDAGAAG